MADCWPIDFHKAFHHIGVLSLGESPSKTEVRRLRQIHQKTDDVITKKGTVPTANQNWNQILQNKWYNPILKN